MISNPDRIQEHEANVKVQRLRHAAKAFGVSVDHVRDIGHSLDRGPLRYYCNHGTFLASLLHEDDPPYPMARRDSIVELKPKFQQVDDLFFTKTTILAGQCEECGRVYISDVREK